MKLIENIKEHIKKFIFGSDGSLRWITRICIYLSFIIFGWLIISKYLVYVLQFFKLSILLEKGNEAPLIYFCIAMFVFMVSIGRWIINTADAKKQFKDSFSAQNELRYSNAISSLSKDNSVIQSEGLREILRLRLEGNIDERRIVDLLNSGLEIKDAKFPHGFKDFKGLSLENIKLEKASLFEADLSETKLNKANLSEADLTEAKLHTTWLVETKLIRANLSRANLYQAILIGADLSGADLTEADLTMANLSKSFLFNNYIKAANLSGADLTKANLTKANLTGAKYNEYTKFPEGFDPKEHGMKKVEFTTYL